jgi:hypothetical protein
LATVAADEAAVQPALPSSSASYSASGSDSRIAPCRSRVCCSSRSTASALGSACSFSSRSSCSARAAGDLLAQQVKVDEHRDFDLQHDRIDRLEHVVDRAHRVAAHQVLGLLVDRRQEDDRDARVCVRCRISAAVS